MKKVLLFSALLLCTNIVATVLFTTLNEATNGTTAWIVRSNVRYAHQFIAGGPATITSCQVQLSAAQKFPDKTKIVIYASSSDIISTKLGELTYSSIDGSNLVTYTGELDITTAGTYWFEIQPTASIANHYYTSTSSTSQTGSLDAWIQKKTKIASGGDSINWTYSSASVFQYPKFALLGTDNSSQTVITLNAAVDLSSGTYLKESGTTLDLSGATLTSAGQTKLEALTGLDESLDGITKANITTLKLSGNLFTEIPANIFSTFPNLKYLELQSNTSLVTINANSFNGLSNIVDLRLDGCTSITTLPTNGFNGLTVSGTLRLDNNTSLATLASGWVTGLTLTGSLRLDGCSSLTGIPANRMSGLTIGGDLNLALTGITQLVANTFNGLTVTGTVTVNSNSSLTTLAANAFNGTIIGGTLKIINNANLVAISENAFDGLTLSGTLELSGNAKVTSIPQTIIDTFYKNSSISGDVRLDSTGITTLENDSFKDTVTSQDLRIDNNADLITISVAAIQGARVGRDLRIDSTGITTLNNYQFKGTQVTRNLHLNGNTSLTTVQPKAFINATVSGTIDLQGTTNLTTLPFCVFDAMQGSTAVQFDANSGIVAALPDGPDKTALINGVTKEQAKQILKRNPTISKTVAVKDYVEIATVTGKRIGLIQ